MPRVVVPDIDPGSLEDTVDPGSYARGVQYLRQRAVGHMWFDGVAALHGRVRGRTGEYYTTTAYFTPGGGEALEFEQGHCSCPVGINCKHVVALVLAACTAGRSPECPDRAPRPVSWERSLESLLDTPPPGGAGEQDGTPLAIELALAPASHALTAARGAVMPPLKLAARLVRPGKGGGWVGGSLSWAKLDSLRYLGGYRTAQVSLLEEIYALYRARGGAAAYHYYGEERTLDLSQLESRRLWPLLDEAICAGVELVYPRKLGRLGPRRPAALLLDATSDGGPLVLTPLLQLDGAASDAVPVCFIGGTQGHGLVYVDRAEAQRGHDYGGWRFRLAELTEPVPPPLQRMTLAGERLAVPAAGLARFEEEYYPRLSRTVTVTSSDGSYTPPVISGPALLLTARYGTGHEVEAGWEWAYQIGGSRLRAPLRPGPPSQGYRDLAAEREILAGLHLPLHRFGLPSPGPQAPPARDAVRGTAGTPPAAARVRLSGTATMRFTTELLPLLADHPGVTVEITGKPPRYREVGDTLRIGVSAAEIAGDRDWFDLGIDITVAGQRVPFSDVFVALSREEPHLLLPDGSYFSLDKPELRALAALIEEARALHDSPPGQLRISRFQAGLWAELAELGIVDHQAAAWRRQAGGLLAGGLPGCPSPPPSVTATMRPYQRDGFGWLALLWENQLGGILADDMGLGKTLQALALISHARQAGPLLPPFLIVAPTSVAPNWAAEAAKFTPSLKVVTLTGTTARHGGSLPALTAGADAVVTSYTLLRLDFAAYSALGWSGLILDEAQHVKNHQSKIHQCVRKLAAPVKLAITGTPMENNLMELWALLSVTAPGLFPSPAAFRDYYARPIEKQGETELLAQLRRRIKPLVKRRTKEQVAADLPAKQELLLEVELHPRHRRIYQTHLQRERQKILRLIGDMDANRFTILRSLTLLRQLSLHAGLVDEAHRDLPSAKIDTLLEQLGDVTGGGHRALVFSQFTGFLGHVRGRLDAAGIGYCYLDGKTRDRAAVVRRFKDGADGVFLISLKAGGFGLNLTEADYCFLLDPWWNPATEAQAVDRAHRIGQARNVMVYRLIARDTIEEKVMALKARKAELFTSVIDQGNVFGGSLSAADVRCLLG
jgi:superfamily II DNA or RNA helicase